MNTRITPLRYPGGKQKITPFIKEIIQNNNLDGCSYIEPYAGGAGVALSLLVNNIVNNIYINDISKNIYAFWYSVINDTERFVLKIRDIPLNIEEWGKQHSIFKSNTDNLFDLGFATFFMNRCNRSGILTGGVIGGKAQSGKWKLDARFNKQDLIKRIECIGAYRDRIHLFNDDAVVFLKNLHLNDNAIIYLDPPYFNKADSLYENYYKNEDHEKIARYLNMYESKPWIISYDYTKEISQLYKNNESFTYSLQYNAAKAYKGTEFFSFSRELNIPENSSLDFINQGLRNRR